MELLIIILIFVVAFKDCAGKSYQDELKQIITKLEHINYKLETLKNLKKNKED